MRPNVKLKQISFWSNKTFDFQGEKKEESLLYCYYLKMKRNGSKRLQTKTAAFSLTFSIFT